jgi:NADPH-dependent ferric siderophore reductase
MQQHEQNPQKEQQREPHKAYRVRHSLKLRRATVQSIEELGPNMRRIVLASPDFADFQSASFDDHIKVFFPDPQTGHLVLPKLEGQGIAVNDGPKPVMRDYTPRYFNTAQQTLTVDFALHEAGPASDWARQAKPDDVLGIGGPRGSMIIPMDFDGYVLIGDDTALPAIGRRLEELPKTAKVLVIAEVEGTLDQQQHWDSPAQTKMIWLHRTGQPKGQPDLLLQALRQAVFPQGDFHIWIATETSVARQLRKALIDVYGVNKNYIKAAGYWQLGKSDAHQVVDDE